MHGRDPQIIHGDIKGVRFKYLPLVTIPDLYCLLQLNVLISNEGNALLCDFGLSKMISDMATMSGTPTELFGAGTIRWMAPELFSDEHGDGSKTSASDIYAFAMLIVEVWMRVSVIIVLLANFCLNFPVDVFGNDALCRSPEHSICYAHGS